MDFFSAVGNEKFIAEQSFEQLTVEKSATKVMTKIFDIENKTKTFSMEILVKSKTEHFGKQKSDIFRLP